MISKTKKILLGVVVGIVLFLTFINWTTTEIRYFPFVDPIRLPLLIVMLLCFGAGAVTSFLYLWLRSGKKSNGPRNR